MKKIIDSRKLLIMAIPGTSSLLLVFFLFAGELQAQQAHTADSATISLKYLKAVEKRVVTLEGTLDRKSQKALERFQRQQNKLLNKLGKVDSVAAQQLKRISALNYSNLLQKLKAPGNLQQYIPHLDSLSTSLNFLSANPQFIQQAAQLKEKLGEVANKVNTLKGQLQKAEDIKFYLKSQKELLRQQFERLGIVQKLKSVNKQVYYYARQMREIKESLDDPKKLEKKILELIARMKPFQEFMRKNSMLASLFRLPSSQDDPAMYIVKRKCTFC